MSLPRRVHALREARSLGDRSPCSERGKWGMKILPVRTLALFVQGHHQRMRYIVSLCDK
jgi:hypothetical protein